MKRYTWPPILFVRRSDLIPGKATRLEKNSAHAHATAPIRRDGAFEQQRWCLIHPLGILPGSPPRSTQTDRADWRGIPGTPGNQSKPHPTRHACCDVCSTGKAKRAICSLVTKSRRKPRPTALSLPLCTTRNEMYNASSKIHPPVHNACACACPRPSHSLAYHRNSSGSVVVHHSHSHFQCPPLPTSSVPVPGTSVIPNPALFGPAINLDVW
ncbi:hypothetical protein B0T18DRAFT_24131 [Schizothecium vesticola]|uniref:Uncharacterized protein n=1 Tax=Schizothecium vesticola TaxID=314040 RepID=A0AA40KC79_9PEZI|nr:hypothetical protein B0T18DRAFT_24131 [Schizothecium vesticola]